MTNVITAISPAKSKDDELPSGTRRRGRDGEVKALSGGVKDDKDEDKNDDDDDDHSRCQSDHSSGTSWPVPAS